MLKTTKFIFRKHYNSMPQIILTPTEKQITSLLQEYIAKYNTDNNPPLTLRITGGWVRDKLMNKPSHDIDIGIDHCSGIDFVTGLKEYVEKECEKQVNNNIDNSCNNKIDNKVENKISGSIHTIKKNPEKSKHLETCTTKLYGLDVDFVNLRSETYTEDSRIPTIEAGTPEEDAFRRDATLNSMFYNLTTMKIEDFTKCGLKDLEQGILRTPLEPRKTFLDDPLRCLRLIRFASTLNFKIDDKALKIMKSQEIKDALEHKISRERIGVEIKKILIGSNPIYGLKLIEDVEFFGIFGLGDTDVKGDFELNHIDLFKNSIQKSLNDIVEKLPNILQDVDIINELKLDIGDNDNEKVVFYSSLILNKWRALKVKVGKKEGFVSTYCVLNGIKMPLKLADLVGLIVSKINSFQQHLSLLSLSLTLNSYKRSEVAQNFILPYGENWRLNIMINFYLECFQNMNDLGPIKNKYESLLKLIDELKLTNVVKESLLLNGKEMMKIINKKPGPWLKRVNEELFIWQLDNYDLDKQDMIEHLKSLDIQ